MSKVVNRSLKDKAMDHMDHALGRPIDPLGETYRNHFAVDTESETAKEFEISPFWKSSGKRGYCGIAFYHVTVDGRKALKKHLRDIGDKHRLFDVEWNGSTDQIVAVSAAKARYSRWLDISDCFPDLKYSAFIRATKVRLSGVSA